MSARAEEPRSLIDIPGLKQAVVFLLLVNFALYAREDWLAAAALAGADATFLDWIGAFATTLDEAAWFALLFLFEFELRFLSRGGGARAFGLLMWCARALCCLVIAHTFFSNVRDLEALLGDGSAVAGELALAWVALVEGLAWLAIILLLFLDERALASGRDAGHAIRGVPKLAGYCVLLFAAAYWAAAGHYLYAWDELLWVSAFGGVDLGFRRSRRAGPAAA